MRRASQSGRDLLADGFVAAPGEELEGPGYEVPTGATATGVTRSDAERLGDDLALTEQLYRTRNFDQLRNTSAGIAAARPRQIYE